MQNTIAQTTMIVALETGLPRQGLQLKEEASKIETDNHAQKGTVKASMLYFRKKSKDEKGQTCEVDGLKKLKEHQSAYRSAVHTLARYPFSPPFYLAPAPVIEDLLKVQTKFEGIGKDGGWTGRTTSIRCGRRMLRPGWASCSSRLTSPR